MNYNNGWKENINALYCVRKKAFKVFTLSYKIYLEGQLKFC